MKDERIIILQMLEKGKITVEEAAALLDALEPAAVREHKEAPAPEHAAETTSSRSGPGDRWEETRERIDSSLKHLRETLREKAPTGDEINAFVRKVQQGVAQVIDELPDVVNRLLHWEFRSGFTGRTAEERFSGTFAEGQKVTVRVHCEDGPVRFAPSEDEGYHVRVVNQVRADDDAHAKALSLETVDWRETENGFELTLKNHPKVRSQVHVALPIGPAYIVDVTSDDGSIVWEKLPAEEVRLTTQDGAVKVSDVKAERLEARTEDGAVWLHKVEANEVRALSADGAVRFRGFARRLRCATDDGAVRAALIAPALPEVDEGELHWELSSQDGAVSLWVPTRDDYGYRLRLTAGEGSVSVSLPGINTTTSGTDGLTGHTAGFEEKRVRATLILRTEDGAIRVAGAREGADA